MNLIPKVNGICEKKEGYLTLSTEFNIANIKGFEDVIDLFATRIKNRLNINILKSDDNLIKLIEDESIDNTTYKIIVDENGVCVKYSSNEGLGYGLTTLYHLIVDAVLKNDSKLKYIKIEDRPKYNHRGLSVDTARHFFPIEELKKIVEQLALVKINVFHWHIVDDQGFRMESKAFPELNKLVGNDYYTQEEIRDFINFAKIRGIDVIPELDMPGHTTSIIQAYPELSCKGEVPEINERTFVYKDVLCGGKAEVYAFVEKLLDEVVGLFTSNRIHLGGDEVPKDRWSECPHCKSKLEEEGLATFEDLQCHLLNHAKKHLEKYNKTVICWNDSLKGDGLDEEINIQYWLDASIEPYSIPKIKQGRKVIFSEVFSVYTDYPHSMTPLQKTYDYVPSIRGVYFEDFVGVLGMEAAIWCERVFTAEDMQRQVFPRVIALAEAAWTTEKDFESFTTRLTEYYGELDFGGITNKTAIEDAGSFGPERIQKALMDFGAIMQGGVDSEGMGMSQEEMQAMMQIFLGGFFTQEELPTVMGLVSQMMQH